MDKEQKRELLGVMAMEFTALEFNLYLDTHPEDQRALNDFYATVHQLDRLKKDYECRYGPLTSFGSTPSKHSWQWLNDPWPWEMIY